MKKLGSLLLVLAGAAAGAHAAAATGPALMTVSPGAIDRVAAVEARCPTFSWAPVAEAVAQELVLLESGEAAPKIDEAEALVRVELPGSASSWTPDLEQCPLPNRTYAWAIRALGEDVGPDWSEPRLFRVMARPAFVPPADVPTIWIGEELPPGLSGVHRVDPPQRAEAPEAVAEGIYIDGLSVPAGHEVLSTSMECPAGHLCGTAVYCGGGKVVMGGGPDLRPTTTGLVLWASYPDNVNEPPASWWVWVHNTTGTPSTFDVHAVCMTLPGLP
jgi:hypothetical protein